MHKNAISTLVVLITALCILFIFLSNTDPDDMDSHTFPNGAPDSINTDTEVKNTPFQITDLIELKVGDVVAGMKVGAITPFVSTYPLYCDSDNSCWKDFPRPMSAGNVRIDFKGPATFEAELLRADGIPGGDFLRIPFKEVHKFPLIHSVNNQGTFDVGVRNQNMIDIHGEGKKNVTIINFSIIRLDGSDVGGYSADVLNIEDIE